MKTKRRFLAAVMVFVIAASVLMPMVVYAATGIRVAYHGEEVDFGSDSPILIDNRIYVPRQIVAQLVDADMPLADAEMLPLRSTFESLGYTIEWDGATRTANISLEGGDGYYAAPTPETETATVIAFMDKLVAGDGLPVRKIHDAFVIRASRNSRFFAQLPVKRSAAFSHGAVVPYRFLNRRDDGLSFPRPVAAAYLAEVIYGSEIVIGRGDKGLSSRSAKVQFCA